MKTIYKYQFDWVNGVDQTFRMPKGAEILTVQNQYEIPTIWAVVDPAESNEDRRIIAVGTGETIPLKSENLKYIGTVQFSKGAFIFHLFEVI